jgi:hypothetical protein
MQLSSQCICCTACPAHVQYLGDSQTCIGLKIRVQVRGLAQIVECMLSKQKALSSTSHTKKKM